MSAVSIDPCLKFTCRCPTLVAAEQCAMLRLGVVWWVLPWRTWAARLRVVGGGVKGRQHSSGSPEPKHERRLWSRQHGHGMRGNR